MKKNLKALFSKLWSVLMEIWTFIFADSAVNHIRLKLENKQKYRSYTELKRRQKKMRTFAAIALLAVVSGLIGILVGPILFPHPIEPEVYIPNGKGDILIANVSKNKATLVFKTLDSANGNKPLATKAVVEVFSDSNFSNLVRRSKENDYAVTHIIETDALQENVQYYVKITATDSAIPAHTQSISAWGDSNDQIKFITTGEAGIACSQNAPGEVAVISGSGDDKTSTIAIAPSRIKDAGNEFQKDETLKIADVQNENYLQPKNKVQTIISWTTNVPASASLVIAEANSNQKTELNISNKLETKHQVVLTTLSPGATYYFEVKSADEKGNLVASENYSLRTPRPEQNILEKITDNFKGLLHQVKPN